MTDIITRAREWLDVGTEEDLAVFDMVRDLLIALEKANKIRSRLDYTVKKFADGAGVDWSELIEEYEYLEEGDLL
jgi:hypothetical protein